MVLVDTHAHISFGHYDKDREAMMQRAFDTGVTKLVHSCCNIDEISKILKFTDIYNGGDKVNLFTAVGIHPIEVKNVDLSRFPEIEVFIKRELEAKGYLQNIKAIGETGLDYYHDTEAEIHTKQQKSFQQHIDLSKKYELPIIVHTRNAWKDTMKMLGDNYEQDSSARNGVIHCFDGELEHAEFCIARGFNISFSGIVTYKKCQTLRDVAATIPLDRILVETDCPYLTPQAKRGERNEPSYVNYIADVIAESRKVLKSDIEKATTANAELMFKI